MAEDNHSVSAADNHKSWAEKLEPYVPRGARLAVLGRLQESYLFEPHPPDIKPLKKDTPLPQGMKAYYPVTEDGMKIALWHKPPADDSKPTYLLFHGSRGHWLDVGIRDVPAEVVYDRAYRVHLLKKIMEQGAGVIAVHLRGYGLSEGSPSENAFQRDVETVLQWMDKQGIASSHTIVLGESLGSAVAAYTAERMTELGKPPAVLGMIASFYSMAERAHVSKPEFTARELNGRLRHHFTNFGALKNVARSTRIYLAHPLDDETTPYEDSQCLYDAVKALPGRRENQNIFLIPLESGHVSWDPQMIVDDTLHLYQHTAHAAHNHSNGCTACR